MPESRINPNGSSRIHTRATQPRTSSNSTFPERLRSGIKSGLDLTNSALRQVTKPIPGSAALSSTISNAAHNLNTNGLDSSLPTPPSGLDGDMNSLQDNMVRNNEEMLAQQMHVAEITTFFTTRSNIIKSYFDGLKTIGSNMRS